MGGSVKRLGLVAASVALLSLISAQAQSPVLPGPGLPTSVAASATCTFQSFATEAAGLSAATFTSVGIGAAASNRVVAVIPMGRITTGGISNPVTAVAFTVGATATLSQVSGAAATTAAIEMASDIWYASVAAGTTATITVTWTTANTRSAIYVYTINTSTPTPAHGAENTSSSAATLAQSITIPTNGCGIVGAAAQQTTNTMTFTNATLDQSNEMSGAANGTEGGHLTTTNSVTANSNVTANAMTISLASWSP